MGFNLKMNENEFELLLFDRLKVIKDVINEYGEDNFYLSFSGGKDSTILSWLIDKALPNNKIPRVFINTGIEYTSIVDFVKECAIQDKRFVILKPQLSIKKVLEKYGYPFKSKEHSTKLYMFQKGNNSSKSIEKYLSDKPFSCPKCLRYQFGGQFNLNVSPLCCTKLKKEPVSKWAKQNNKSISITGMRKQEGGQRTTLSCILTDKTNKVVKFHPLAVVSGEWEDWLVKKENIKLCSLYYEPFNFKRTGCVGCPFNIHLKEQLEIMSIYLPIDRKRCELIWDKVYNEYRKIGYRLK